MKFERASETTAPSGGGHCASPTQQPDDTARFNIGEAARQSSVSTKMVRHYESLGLLPEIARTDAGYRLYGPKEVHTLRFIKRSRELGFSMVEIAGLLKLWQNQQRSSLDVRNIATRHLDELNQRISEMQAMKTTLEHLITCCQGDHRPDCPILDDLGEQKARPLPAKTRKKPQETARSGSTFGST